MAVENGKISGVRILGDGKMEYTYQGMGKLLDRDSVSLYTALGTMQPDGSIVFEANGVVRSLDGDVVTVRVWGVNRSTGPGYKASGRGGAITQTASPKFAKLNNAPNVWEAETTDTGEYYLKVWDWK